MKLFCTAKNIIANSYVRLEKRHSFIVPREARAEGPSVARFKKICSVEGPSIAWGSRVDRCKAMESRVDFIPREARAEGSSVAVFINLSSRMPEHSEVFRVGIARGSL